MGSNFVRVFLFNIFLSPNLNMFGKVDNQTQILNCILINGPYRIIDKAARSQDGQSKYPGIMGLILIKGSNSLSVNNNNVKFLSIGSLTLDRRPPAPKPLRAGIDSRTNTKPITSIQQHLIKKVRFSCSVQTGHGDNSDGPGDTSYEFACLRGEDVLLGQK